MKRFATWIIAVLMLLTLAACGAKDDGAGTNDPSQSGNGEPQGNTQTSPYQVTQDQWDAIIATAFDNFTCDASTINGQIYMMSPAEGLYARRSVEGGSTYYYIHKGDKVDYYFVNGDRVELFTDESWESHGRNATGEFDFSSDWLDWLPGIYNLQEFQYSEDSRAYTFPIPASISSFILKTASCSAWCMPMSGASESTASSAQRRSPCLPPSEPLPVTVSGIALARWLKRKYAQ